MNFSCINECFQTITDEDVLEAMKKFRVIRISLLLTFFRFTGSPWKGPMLVSAFITPTVGHAVRNF